MQKGSSDWIPWIIGAGAGIVLALTLFVWSGYKITETLHDVCVSNLQKTVYDIQTDIFAGLKNDGNKIQIPVTLGDCVEGIAFSNRDALQSLKESYLKTEFKCPEGYQGLIIGSPKTEEVSWWKILQGDKSELLKAAAGQLDSLKLKPFCKNLPKPEYKFSESKSVERTKTNQKFCIQITKEKAGIFSLAYQEILEDNQYDKCKNQEFKIL